jgi:hypothetical protein
LFQGFFRSDLTVVFRNHGGSLDRKRCDVEGRKGGGVRLAGDADLLHRLLGRGIIASIRGFGIPDASLEPQVGEGWPGFKGWR